MGDFEEMENNNKAASDEAEAEAEAGVDRLSKLPDHILLNILERVETLDALRACILSKRMLELPPMLSLLDINIGSLVRCLRPNVDILHQIFQYNIAVAAITVKILSARNPEIPIRELRVRFCLRHDECLSISQAVARAMATHKQHLDVAEFVVLTEKSSLRCTQDHLLSFAKRFNTWFAHCPAAFAGLTRLWLRNLRFGEPDGIHSILTTCKRLQFLGLSHCDSGVRSVLRVEHAQLVVLHIEYGKFRAVRLNSVPKLQRVNYTGWSYQQDPLIFASVPQLSKLMLVKVGVSSTSNIKLSQLLANVPWISNLRLDFQSEKIWVLPECPKLLAPVLGKLQIVNLVNLPQGCDIDWTLFILAASSLKELCITVWDHWCEMETNKDVRRKKGYCEKANVEWQPSDAHFKHKNLVKLTIYGFQPEENFVQYIRRVMEIAVNMKEICLHDWQVCEDCADLDPNIVKVCPSRYPRTSEEKDMLREEITKELPMASPAVIHFRS